MKNISGIIKSERSLYRQIKFARRLTVGGAGVSRKLRIISFLLAILQTDSTTNSHTSSKITKISLE